MTGALHGVPVTLKINVDFAGRPTTNGRRGEVGDAHRRRRLHLLDVHARQELVRAVESDINRYSMETNKKAEAAWKERGAEFIRITGPDQVEFEKRMRAAGDEVVAKNPRIQEAYELMVERARATRK